MKGWVFMNILAAIIGLSLVMFIHELGHFIGAKLGGMRVRQLALGLVSVCLASKETALITV